MFSLWPFRGKAKPSLLPEVDAVPDQPISFGYKTAWFAVRTDTPWHVCDALALNDVIEANWRTGLDRAHHYPSVGDVFITPPVKGWTCVVGNCLPYELTRDFKRVVSKLSRAVGEVCFFQSYRVSDVYAWAHGVNGNLTRYYASIEGAIVSEGAETEAEMDWVLPSRDPETDDDAIFVDEDVVLDVASNWTFDPREIETFTGLEGTGYVGRNRVWGNV